MVDKTNEDEQKTERFNMFLSPSEMKAIEDWAWENRIRSKSEAVRQLCSIGLLALEKRQTNMNAAIGMLNEVIRLMEALRDSATHHDQAIATGKRAIESAATLLGRPYGYVQMMTSRFQDGETAENPYEEVIETAGFVKKMLLDDYKKVAQR